MGYREAVMVQGVFSLNKFFFDRQFHCFKPTKLSSRDGFKNVVQNVIFHLGSHRLASTFSNQIFQIARAVQFVICQFACLKFSFHFDFDLAIRMLTSFTAQMSKSCRK